MTTMRSKQLRGYWTEDEMRTWACDDALFVHMFPRGEHAGYPSACGKVIQQPGLSEDLGTLAPLEDWGNGNNTSVLCTDCLDLWWKGPDGRTLHLPEIRYANLWTFTRFMGVWSHLVDSGTIAACGTDTGTRVSAPLLEIAEDLRTRTSGDVEVCYTCAVIWDTQAGRDAGMDASEGRQWGYAHDDHERVHRFWNLDLSGGTVELTHCAPYRMPMTSGTWTPGTLDEFVDPEVPPCPICLTTTEEPDVLVTETPCVPSTQTEQDVVREKAQEVRNAAQKVVQERQSPVASRMRARIHRIIDRGSLQNELPHEAEFVVRHYLNHYREEIAQELEGHADERDALADLCELEGTGSGVPDRRAASCYR